MSTRRSMRLRSSSSAVEEKEEPTSASEEPLPKKRKRRSATHTPSGESESEKNERKRRGKRQRKRETPPALEGECRREELGTDVTHNESHAVSPSSQTLLVSSTAASTEAIVEDPPLVVDQEALDALEDVTERQLGECELFNIVANPPSPRPERDAPRKAIFASDLADMMYGKGDVRHPSKESIALLDKIVQEYIESMMRSTIDEVTSQKKTWSMNETDLLFRVRHDKAKFERAVYLLKVSREVKQIKNAWKLQTSVSDDEDESLFN